jgi:acetylornithine aminotransferase
VPFYDANDPQASTARALATLRQHLSRYPGQHAAMCFELVQGEGGYYPGDRDFFLALIDELKAHDVAVLIDEIQTFGRLSRLFAFQQFQLDEHIDIVTIGKLSQICATLFTDAYTPRPGLISQTFTGATAAIFAAQTIIDTLLNGNFFGETGRTARVHQRFAQHFDAMAERHPGLLQGPYGSGGMIAFTPVDGSAATAKNVLHRLYDRGVIAFVAGSDPARIRFLPPVAVITDDQIDEVCGLIETALGES